MQNATFLKSISSSSVAVPTTDSIRSYTNSFKVIESYQIPCDVNLNEHFVEKGSWLMTLQVNDSDVWEMIKTDDINGISIGAMAEVEDL